MDSDETLTSQSQFSSSVQLMDDVSLEDIMNCQGGYDHSSSQNHLFQQKYMSSRLSTCSSYGNGGQGVDQEGSNLDYCDHGGYTSMCSLHSTSLLSVESFDGGADADGELSDDNTEDKEPFLVGFSSDSENGEVIGSLPATPPGNRPIVTSTQRWLMLAKKDCGSETDAQKNTQDRNQKSYRNYKRTKGRFRSKSGRKNSTFDDYVADKKNHMCLSGGESEGSGLIVITKPKGGSKSICMDMEEVKACRELGFELEHERVLELPSRLSVSVANLENSSGGNSPISSWRISSPGDNPREVKARLKVWAQAVAIASTTSKPPN